MNDPTHETKITPDRRRPESRTWLAIILAFAMPLGLLLGIFGWLLSEVFAHRYSDAEAEARLFATTLAQMSTSIAISSQGMEIRAAVREITESRGSEDAGVQPDDPLAPEVLSQEISDALAVAVLARDLHTCILVMDGPVKPQPPTAARRPHWYEEDMCIEVLAALDRFLEPDLPDHLEGDASMIFYDPRSLSGLSEGALQHVRERAAEFISAVAPHRISLTNAGLRMRAELAGRLSTLQATAGMRAAQSRVTRALFYVLGGFGLLLVFFAESRSSLCALHSEQPRRSRCA